MLKKLYEFLYVKIFVNIIIERSKTTVHIETRNSKDLIASDVEVFDTKYLSSEMHEYISSFTKETPFFYISILDNSKSQGIIPTCSKSQVNYFYDVSASEYKCFNDTWIFYTAKSDMYEIERVYEKIGVDFIFSPFVVLNHFFKEKIDTHLAMFILVQEDAISLSVFDNSQLLYGEFLDISESFESEDLLIDDVEIEDVELEDEEDEGSIDLDDMDALDDMDELDDFGDIADLDSIEDIDEFSESKDIEEELDAAEVEEEFSPESTGDNEDYQRFIAIQNSVNDFYSNEKYTSDFIENVYIADSIGLSPDLKKYLEEEMFLNVYVRQIDLASEISSLAKMELV